ncbi:MAG: NAD(P)-dependent oxidoreductase [Planctomycetota bacterium]
MPELKVASPGETRIGWIGTGVMGHSMLGHLLDAGYVCSVFTRTASKAQDLVQRGAAARSGPGDVARNSDVVFSIVGYPHDVESIYLGDDGIVANAAPGSVLVDMTTSKPELATRIASASLAKGCAAIDAPVSGGDRGAREGVLSIMVGGETEPVRAVMPLLEVMGKTIVHQGGPGTGQHTKMVNQTLIASGMIGVCEALLYAYRSGLDVERVLQSVSGGAAGSWSLTHLAPRIVAGDYQPGFYVEHFLKDMGIALDEAARLELCLPGLALAKQLYQALAAQGHAKSGTQALVLALAKINNMQIGHDD